MSLRTKLLLGYMLFIGALVVLGGWSAWRLHEMGGVSRRIIANNYDSVGAAQDMKESLERQDSAAAADVARRWFLLTLLIAGTLVCAGLALAILLSNRIVLPLRQLTATTARIAGGDLNAQVEVASRDEVGLLAVEYNRMAERIRQLRRSDLGQLVVAQQTTEATIDS